MVFLPTSRYNSGATLMYKFILRSLWWVINGLVCIPTLRYNSGATLMYKFILRSLWWVINGLAVAPPGIVFIIGVST